MHKSGYIYRGLSFSHILIGIDLHVRLIGFSESSNSSKLQFSENPDFMPPEFDFGKFD